MPQIFACRFALPSALAMSFVAAWSLASSAGGHNGKCTEDAIIVFDSSASMADRSWDMTGLRSRHASVRAALAEVLPRVEGIRAMGLIVYGPSQHSCHSIDLRVTPSRYSAARILENIDRTAPAGRTPLTAAVRQAAELLDYRKKPAVVVLVTDGEESCGGSPCATARKLASMGRDLTIHVIGYAPGRIDDMQGFEAGCMAKNTKGLYVTTKTTNELVAALRKTLSCPQLSMAD